MDETIEILEALNDSELEPNTITDVVMAGVVVYAVYCMGRVTWNAAKTIRRDVKIIKSRMAK